METRYHGKKERRELWTREVGPSKDSSGRVVVLLIARSEIRRHLKPTVESLARKRVRLVRCCFLEALSRKKEGGEWDVVVVKKEEEMERNRKGCGYFSLCPFFI